MHADGHRSPTELDSLPSLSLLQVELSVAQTLLPVSPRIG